jgi:hypothetical protein
MKKFEFTLETLSVSKKEKKKSAKRMAMPKIA